MNCFDTRTVRRGAFWYGEFRAAEHGRFRTVKEKGRDKPFPSREAASAAAKDALIAHMNGAYRRSGETASQARAAAEKFFRGSRRREHA